MNKTPNPPKKHREGEMLVEERESQNIRRVVNEKSRGSPPESLLYVLGSTERAE
jgi:hypothetical protein